MNIKFDLRAEGEALPEAFLDQAELEQMFLSTSRSIEAGLRRKFTDIQCGEHARAPTFQISGVYDRAIEEMDIQYHVDTCCHYFLLRVMRILNQRA